MFFVSLNQNKILNVEGFLKAVSLCKSMEPDVDVGCLKLTVNQGSVFIYLFIFYFNDCVNYSKNLKFTIKKAFGQVLFIHLLVLLQDLQI